MPLPSALQCLAEVAQTLGDIHLGGRAHGQLQAAAVLITATGSELRLPGAAVAEGDPEGDVVAFGALIFETLTGAKLEPGAPPPPVARVRGPRLDPDAIRADALRVAVRCLSAPAGERQDLAKAAAELRVLAVLARQAERGARIYPAEVDETTSDDLVLPEDPGISVEDPAGSAGERAPAAEDAAVAAGEAGIPEAPLERIEPPVPMALVKEEKRTASPPVDPNLPEYRRCPGCHSADVHTSKPRTGPEKLGALALRIPLYRCHQCYHRWFLLFRVAIPCKVQKVHRRSF